ncbi:MAG: hypothetical protein NPINA01_25490 [Nitrospinaceae bacterium]|nr:MAG: hypothetical protein NPINA01_25490 [Nitrospinaceae bacterium]
MKKGISRLIKNFFLLSVVCPFAFHSLITGTVSADTVQAVDVSSACPQKRKTPKAPVKEYSRVNPLPGTPENIKAGEQIFLKKATPIACQFCHGVKGDSKGDPDFESKPAARNFTCSEMMEAIPDGQLFWVIKNGSPNTAMPAFSDLSEESVWQVIHYIRQFAN